MGITMKPKITIAWLGNFIDMTSTLYLVGLGYVEANPFMRPLMGNPLLFATVKLCSMTALLWYLWQHKTDKHAEPLATLAAAVYGGISIYYGFFFAVIL